MQINRRDFGKDFQWGVSTAAYQIEGAHRMDGKGLSIWDRFCADQRKSLRGMHGNTACDFYHRYPADIGLIHQLQIPSFRFSISWSRIFPEGIGQLNAKGVDFYNRVIDACLEYGIRPWITLYHWDLPQALQQKGGWENRDILQWFGAYAAFCVQQFGDRVNRWMILNEPMVFTGAGYFLGVHAPGKKGLGSFLAAVHHAALCQAEGGRIVKSLHPASSVGTTFSYSHLEPYRNREKDVSATRKADALLNRLFIEPLLGLGYPIPDLKVLQRLEKFYKAGDDSRLACDMDFVGLQNYTREMISYAPLMPFIKAKIVKASKRRAEYTQMGWEVYPPSIYHALMRWKEYKNLKEIIITENGAAFEDRIEDGKVEDTRRIKYLADHIDQVLRAKREGACVNGYFVWTLIDNFEWAEGYYPKFGLIHFNPDTQERTVKASGRWYAEFLKGI